MMEQLQINTTTTEDYEIRREVVQGEAHIIVPVVMMVEGVHNGSLGPLLHTAGELEQSVAKWNNIPVTALHPQDANGQNISAFTDAGQPFIVGYLEDVRMDGVKLKANARIRENRLLAVSPQALEYIKDKKSLDVSVGVFSTEDEVSGEWGGETYTAVSRDYIPDHLALLPGERGACSWEDGCGIRVNKDCESSINQNQVVMSDSMKKTLKAVHAKGFSPTLVVNEASIHDTLDKMYRLIDGLDNPGQSHYLVELYNDYVIYRGMNANNRDEKYYKQTYSIDSDDNVALTGTPEHVRRRVEYVSIQQNREEGAESTNHKNEGGNSMSKVELTPCAKAKVDGLITNARTKFAESDRVWLESQDETTLAKLEPSAEEKPQTNADNTEKPITREKALEVLGLKDLADYKAIMPDDIKKQVESAMELRETRRTELIKSIQTNSAKDTWTEDELKGMSCDMLMKINKSITTPVDYSGAGAGGDGSQTIQDNSDGPAPLLPPQTSKKK